MEARISGETFPFYGPGPSDVNGIGRKGLEWDLNGWKWDGNMFLATPLNVAPSDCGSKQLFPGPENGVQSNSSSSCSDDTDTGPNGKGKGELEKRRRIIVVEDEQNDKAGSLTLKLGGHVYPIVEADLADWEGSNSKRSKVQSGNSNRGVCQVEGCNADLSDAKDYHRRHKVCEMHAKASRALVGNVIQRFCQQCSRFHHLQEFDEGKRSCRRRLAGHNKRRRKNHPHASASESAMTDGRDSSYLLITLLRILSNLQPNSSEQSKDQDLVSHFLRNIASLAGALDAGNLSSLLQTSQTSQDLQKTGDAAGTSSQGAHALPSNGHNVLESSRPLCSSPHLNSVTEARDFPRRPTSGTVSATVPAKAMSQTVNVTGCPLEENPQAVTCQRSSSMVTEQDVCPALNSLPQLLPAKSSAQKVRSNVELVRLKSFDLNNAYDGQDGAEELEKVGGPVNLGTGSLNCPSWMLQECHNTSPPQTSGNSDSASAQSLTSSNGDAPSRTDRIVFKLFGKDPNDFPLVLRSQIVHWLSNSPSDIESYIRPGCIILTIYLRLPESTWGEICRSLSSSLRRLLDLAGDEFWRTGWIYSRVQHQMAFIYNGQLVLDTPLLLSNHNHCKILSVSPIAVSVSEGVDFTVKGFNLARSTMRLLCAFEGKYLFQETAHALVDDDTDDAYSVDGPQCLRFSCSLPDATGRGFVEVEDYGLSGSFFPFIVAEPEICSEIRMLESTIDVTLSESSFEEGSAGMKVRTQALDFLHEMGWLLRRCHLRCTAKENNSSSSEFSLARFKWLMEFSMGNEWCAVVKKLLDILLGGAVDTDGHPIEIALEKMALLHSAVQKNSRPMVELLLRYIPGEELGRTGSQKAHVRTCPESFLFRPDMLGTVGMTPLHLAASRGDAESVLDALTGDPGQVGVIAWKSIRDSTGFTPADYARSRGYMSYIHLVEQKITNQPVVGHVVLDIPAPSSSHKQTDVPNSSKLTSFPVEESKSRPTVRPLCKVCSQQQLAYINRNRSSLVYRPAMLSMVGIAAVCVCVGLLLKSPPEVMFVFPPFSWDSLGYGSM